MRLFDMDSKEDYLLDGKYKVATPYAPLVNVVEVVRCKDCRWWDNSEDRPYGYCMAIKHGYMSKNWEIGIYRLYKGDFYCADAERKEDDKSCDTCKHNDKGWDDAICDGCTTADSRWERKDDE